MAKDKKLYQEVNEWDKIDLPYCRYCFKKLKGKKKWDKQKFCSMEHRDLYAMIHNRLEKTIYEHMNEMDVRNCEREGCDNKLNEHQYKFCSVICRTTVSKESVAKKRQCKRPGCEGDVELQNKAYCSRECFNKDKLRVAKTDRDLLWIKVKCRNCGKVHEKTRAQADKYHNKFCTQLCYIEWQQKDTGDGAGPRFLWDSRRNPVRSKKGIVEHHDEHVRNYLISLIEKNEVIEWTLPAKSLMLNGGIMYRPTVILEYSDGHKEAIEVAEPNQSIRDKSYMRWQMIEHMISQLDPSISKCKVVYHDEIPTPVVE